MKNPLLIVFPFLLLSCTSHQEQPSEFEVAEVIYASLNGSTISQTRVPFGVSVDDFDYVLTFNKDLDASSVDAGQISFTGASVADFDIYAEGKELHIKANTRLPYYTKVTFNLYAGKNFGVKVLYDYKFSFITELDPSDRMERIPEDELFEKVQKGAFDYFWEYAHPVSGLARERLGSGNTVTTGGSGFGLMCIPVGIERGWISREEGAQRALTAVSFLEDKAERFHGAWPHWLDGQSGKTIAFGTYDNGADLVETAFMVEGLLALKEYFTGADAVESEIRDRVQRLWEQVEWTWFQKDGEPRLYWHWSPDYEWRMNMPVSGWNEGLIVYILAASSPTYPIAKEVYDNGWAGNGSIYFNAKSPMFFAHYSFLGLDPRHLQDKYGNYWDINVTHAVTNYEYCANSTRDYGYSSVCWGLTASDYYNGYTASSPSNDTGTVAPTAALASMPYTPEQSKAAMEYFYYKLGDRLWGTYGFKDAFALKEMWFANSYIAIDQGPIVVMMENYRTGLLWDTFMHNEDVRKGLDRLEFTF